MNPCQPVTEYILLAFLRQICFFSCVFLGYLGLSISKLSGERKQKQENPNSSTAWQGLIEHVCKQSRSISKNRRERLDFCAENMFFCVVALYLLSSSIGSPSGVKYDWILALRSQTFEYLRETFCRHALEYLQSPRAEKR